MTTTGPPDKQERGKPRKRRYFRRRRRKGSQGASPASRQGGGGNDAPAAQRARPKNQNRRRNENRRRPSRRRGNTARASAKPAPQAAEETRPQGDVYIYTHVIRPAYKDGAGGEESMRHHALNLSGATASAPIGMDHLLESIGRQLDEWFGLSPDPATQDNDDGEANRPESDPTGGGSSPAPGLGDAPDLEVGGRDRADDDDLSPANGTPSGAKD